MLCISCAENLFLIPHSDGIASNAEIPVTVYLKGVLDGGRICGYSVLHHGKSLQTKPVLQFGTHIRPDYSVVWNKHRHSAGVFSFLASYLQKISNSSTARGAHTAANYKLIFSERLLVSAPFLETSPPTRFMLAVGEQLHLLPLGF